MPAIQANREVAVTCALGPEVLLFQRMTGTEALGRLPEYRVQLLTESGDIKFADVLGKPMGIRVELADGSKRHFHGVVTRFASTGSRDQFACYEATIHPWLWLLTRSSNCRIFQDKSVLDIVKAVCGDAAYGGLVDLDAGSLSGTYPALPYCVQYRETDFNFVCRLLEEAGIYFYFKHDESKHTMVLADSYGAHTANPGYEKLEFRGDNGRGVLDREAVFGWSAAGEIQPSSYALNDFDFEKASASTGGGLRVKSTIAAAFSQQAFEQYDYPGGYASADDGNALARGRMESLHGQCEQLVGDTNARGLCTGGLFTLAEHPHADQNREYLVTAADYVIVADDYRSGGGGAGLQFNCRFCAIGTKHSYRAPRHLRKRVVRGPQTAMVVGKAGEEIWTDKYGRIKVRFHWDRDGADDENSSCWVRVAQAWAGKGWGVMSIPRIGMEVVVSFLEGDPDRPLVTGCVYNGDSMPPYALPGEQTKSVIRTNSSKGGGGYNEIRFEDKKNSEEIYVQAEKDFNRVVKNNDTLKVGFEKADKGDQTISIKNDQSLTVGHDQAIKVDNNQSVKIAGDQKVKVDKTIVIEATTSIELKVGSSSIKLEPAKVTIKSPEIAIAADGNAEFKAGAMMTVKSGAVMTIEGSLVKIN
ncbi:type VI secretion system Vgr family protein [Massilia horti]|uniref:Type VI secretion system tip protein VgrG n=1 Tax=Massilia horti TaxID=2562153 RepID=A0A4Y9SYR3_9BURK|nr:type VI secretion system tip protein VgrG [Massilia horti]TFW31982.1 type VI secretion system tip protein VgrG [Massilia horti]